MNHSKITPEQLETAKTLIKDYLKVHTNLDDAFMDQMMVHIPFAFCAKGETLLKQGDAPLAKYFVVQGLVRQYLYNEEGKEVAVDFFTEDQSISTFSFPDSEGLSLFGLDALEDTIIVECADLEGAEVFDDFSENDELSAMQQRLLETDYKLLKQQLVSHKALSPERRYLELLTAHPKWVGRVPQHMIASYLGIAPESLSRIRKRLEQG